MKEELISICIPAYNASKFISQTLHSVQKQTYTNWELIVVEDATNDGTKNIVEAFRQNVRQRVVYVRNEKNCGPAVSRNIASEFSNGNWIAFLDSDDIWLEEHLSDLIKTWQLHQDCDLIHSGTNVFESESDSIITKQYLSDEVLKLFPISLFDGSYGIMPSQVMILRSTFNRIGRFNKNVSYGIEDLELWFRCARANVKFAFTGNNTCLYRKHPAALTQNVLKMTLGHAQVYDSFSDWPSIPKKVRISHVSGIWLAAAKIARKNDKALAKNCLTASMKYKKTPKNLLFWVFAKTPLF